MATNITTALKALVDSGLLTAEEAEAKMALYHRRSLEAALREAVVKAVADVLGDGYALYGLVIRDTNGNIAYEIGAPDWDQYRHVTMTQTNRGNRGNRGNRRYSEGFVNICKQLAEEAGVAWYGVSTFLRTKWLADKAFKLAAERGIPIEA